MHTRAANFVRDVPVCVCVELQYSIVN